MATIATVKDPPIRTLMAVSSSNKGNSGEKIPRRKPVYPISAERELARAMLPVSVIIRKKSKPYLQRMMAVYDAWAQENVRTDARISMTDAIGMILDEYADDIQSGIDDIALDEKIYRTAKYARGISIRDWKALVDDALDLNIDEPFYEETMEDLINKWTYESSNLIKSYPDEYKRKVQEIITWGFTTKQPMVNVYRRLEKATGDTSSHVRMIARDQMGTLNYQMTRREHESMGVSEYIWITKRDARVRDCHRALHGHKFSWNNPPAQWYTTKSKGIVYTGQYCHPGQAYQCRCRAQPVFQEKMVDSIVSQQRVRRKQRG